MFEAYWHEKQEQWRIRFDAVDICCAVNEVVARQTVMMLQDSRKDHYHD